MIKPKEVEEQTETIVSTTETTTESTEVESDIEDTEDDGISEFVLLYNDNKDDVEFAMLTVNYEGKWEISCMFDGKNPKKEATYFSIILATIVKKFKNVECSIYITEDAKNGTINNYKIVYQDNEIVSINVPLSWVDCLEFEELEKNISTDEFTKTFENIEQAIDNVIKKCNEQGETGFLDDIKDNIKD